jgi:hypothetical protein
LFAGGAIWSLYWRCDVLALAVAGGTPTIHESHTTDARWQRNEYSKGKRQTVKGAAAESFSGDRAIPYDGDVVLVRVLYHAACELWRCHCHGIYLTRPSRNPNRCTDRWYDDYSTMQKSSLIIQSSLNSKDWNFIHY